YERKAIKPLFPFGFGLSYTSFAYNNLTIKAATGGASGPRYDVTFDVKNTGGHAGADVAQIYVSDSHAKVQRPPKELKGFAKVNLRPGETKRVSISLDGRAFSYYDAEAKQWRVDPGEFEILVGRSSQQIELRGKLMLEAGPAAGSR